MQSTSALKTFPFRNRSSRGVRPRRERPWRSQYHIKKYGGNTANTKKTEIMHGKLAGGVGSQG